MVNNPGKAIRDKNIGSLFRKAYEKAATVGNAVNGFRRCGIQPFDPHIFSDMDYAPALTTEGEMKDLKKMKLIQHHQMKITLINYVKTRPSLVCENTLKKEIRRTIEVRIITKLDVKRNIFLNTDDSPQLVDDLGQPGPSGLNRQPNKGNFTDPGPSGVSVTNKKKNSFN